MLAGAGLDLKAAKNSLASGDYGWSLAIAYNAMLQATRGLMLKLGFQPAGDQQHYSAVKFASEALGPDGSELVSLFNRMRKKRNEVVYEERGIVSKEEAERSVQNAEKFVEAISRAFQK